ncbi:glycosyltransferase [Paenibacillus lautus]|uniref:glycosyltransferase n=1 Tax=Paenibacillus lautus TaxID=1401 RepID=UPI00345F27D1
MSPIVSIIVSTMRPDFMNNIFQNYAHQKVKNKEMIIILNRDDMDIKYWRKMASKYKNVTVYKVSEKYNLGACLNYGIKKAKYNVIAKFDDDDYYAPCYLKESLDALARSKASIVGKHTAYIYFEEKKALMLYRDGGERKYRRKVKGGTLVFKKDVWNKIKFDEKQVNGSDSDFLRRCKRMGYKIYSVSKHNYVCIRRRDIHSHTQKTSTKNYMARCKLVSYTNNFIPRITRNDTV